MNYQERLSVLQTEIKALNMEAIALKESSRELRDTDNFEDRLSAQRKLEDLSYQSGARDLEISHIKNELYALDVMSALGHRTTITAMNEESLALQRKQVELLEIIARKLCPEQLREW